MDMTKIEAIKAYLLSDGNYDFPFYKYLTSVHSKTGTWVHPRIMFSEWFFDDMEYVDNDSSFKFTIVDLIKLARKSPDYNPDDPFVWYADGQLHSAKRIYPDVYDAEKVATWCVENNDDLDWDDEIHAILFGKEE